jgi:hypothetical protein
MCYLTGRLLPRGWRTDCRRPFNKFRSSGRAQATCLFGEQSDSLLTNVRVRITLDFRLSVGAWFGVNAWIAVCVPINVNLPLDLRVPIYIYVPVGLDSPIDVYVLVLLRAFTAVISVVVTEMPT